MVKKVGWKTAAFLCVVTVVAVYFGMYYLVQAPLEEEVATLQTQVTSLTAQLAAVPAVITPQALTIVYSNTSMNFSTDIASDGSVATAKTLNTTITVTNTNSEDVTDAVWYVVLPTALQVDALDITLVIGGQTVPVWTGITLKQASLPTVYANYGVLTMRADYAVSIAAAGTFKDATTYPTKAIVKQTAANYAQEQIIYIYT